MLDPRQRHRPLVQRRWQQRIDRKLPPIPHWSGRARALTGCMALALAPPGALGCHQRGVRVALGPHTYVCGEYRYLYVGSNDQMFGNTADATHVPTTAWTVRFDDASYHLASVGLGFNF